MYHRKFQPHTHTSVNPRDDFTSTPLGIRTAVPTFSPN